MAAAIKLCVAILALPAVSGLVLTKAQKQCCADSISLPLADGGNYASPYASGKMKADGTCGEFQPTSTIAEPRTRFGEAVQCRTIGMYQEDPWADAGCQMACSVCTDCDLAPDTATQDPANGLALANPHPCGAKMHSFDPYQVCKPNECEAGCGWANIDMDSVTGGYEAIKNDADVATKISLTFKTKQGHDDEDLKNSTGDGPFRHGGTVGSFEYQSLNKRYFLPCKQAGNGEKTIKVTVTRPADLTEFGGEWVKSYPKDSWSNETNEYEPYTFNDYGSKIPLDEFRPVTINPITKQKLDDDADDATELNVFMEMSKDGDYEIRYGNPHLSYAHALGEPLGELQQGKKAVADGQPITDGQPDPAVKSRWVAVEFKKSQLRVGSPWSDCGDGAVTDGASDYTAIGTIIPVYLGNPSLLIASYMGIRDTLTAAYTGAAETLKTKIILNIFTPTSDSEGNPELSRSSGWTDGGKGKATKHCDRRWKEGDAVTAANGCVDATYTQCYSAGEPCPLDHSVCKVEYCELQRWREIIKGYKDIGIHVEVLGLIETKEKVDDTCEDPDGCCATCTTKCCDRQQRSPDDIKDDMVAYNNNVGGADGIDGFYFNEAHGDTDDLNELMTIRAQAAADDFVVFGNGQPLFEPGSTWEANAGAPDVWVTLHETSGKLGFWTPFSWFPSVSQDKWGAMVYNVDALDVTESLQVLFDRGYGYVYLHSEANYASTSTHLEELITGIGAVSTSTDSLAGVRRRLDAVLPARKLQEDDGITRRTWGCDETMMQCRPVCLESNGLITSIVQSKLCGDPSEDMDECSCPCYYDAYWTCAEDIVVCMATRTGQEGPSVVGDLICANRGTPKPVFTQEQRQAGACANKLSSAMGTTPPTSICLERATRAAAAAKKGAQFGEDMEMDLGIDMMASSVSIALAAVGMAMVA
jgi:hypothetical protein